MPYCFLFIVNTAAVVQAFEYHQHLRIGGRCAGGGEKRRWMCKGIGGDGMREREREREKV